MGLPKEPRQKMINMMYLVLTALLALNVSSEILNAFKTVNNSIIKANTVLEANNNTIYSSMEEKKKDPASREKAMIWAPKAAQIQNYSRIVYDSIEHLKLRLMIESGYDPERARTKNDSSFREDNLDAATRMFDTHGEGKKLLQMLTDYKKSVLSDPELNKEFANKLPIDLKVPKSKAGNTNLDWTTAYFHMTPTIAALTILSKFQNDIKNSENQIVSYCHSQIGAVKIRYDKFDFVGGLSSSYLMPGEKLSVTAGLGTTSSGVPPTIFINGKQVGLDQDGLAKTDFNVGSSGKVHVQIKYTDPDGKQQTIDRDLDYTVGMPAGVAVSPDKMNVLYVGVDNPLTITAGAGAEKVNASFSAPGVIHRVGGNKWSVKPSGTAGEYNVNVTVEGKTTPVKFRVKYLPNPASYIGSSRGGSISSAGFKAQGGMVARLEESDFEASFKVIGYKLGAIGGPIQTYTEAANESNRWSGNAASIVTRAGPGTNIFFDDIRVVGPDGRTRQIPPMVFSLK